MLVEFTDKTKGAIVSTADYLSADAGGCSKIDLAELVLYADHMSSNGHRDADKEVASLIKEHGWVKVKSAAAALL